MICHHRLARLLAYKPSISHLLFILDAFTIPLLLFSSAHLPRFQSRTARQRVSGYPPFTYASPSASASASALASAYLPVTTLRQSITTYPPLLPRSGQSLHHTTPRTTTPRRPLRALFVLGSPLLPNLFHIVQRVKRAFLRRRRYHVLTCLLTCLLTHFAF